ncbi:unnamed protein product [Brassica oleracea var. botrytis]
MSKQGRLMGVDMLLLDSKLLAFQTYFPTAVVGKIMGIRTAYSEESQSTPHDDHPNHWSSDVCLSI